MKPRIIIPVAAIALIGFLGVGTFVHYSTMEDVSFTVKKTERVITGSGNSTSSKYLVYTDNEVFENTDTLLSMKFNSSDIYANMDNGIECDATVNGFRVPFVSMYRNIIDADCN